MIKNALSSHSWKETSIHEGICFLFPYISTKYPRFRGDYQLLLWF